MVNVFVRAEFIFRQSESGFRRRSMTFSSKTLVYVLPIAIAAFCGSAHAQFVGQGAPVAPALGALNPAGTAEVKVTPVAEILKNPIDDIYVLVRGRLTRKLRHEHYEFTDGTGTIRVEIDDEDFVRQTVTENTVVELYGELDVDYMSSPEIEVEWMRIVPK
jgi:uncharacterized protein (TIGR00156 family)